MQSGLRAHFFYFLLLALTVVLLYFITKTPQFAEPLKSFWGIWLFSQMGTFLIVGIGFAIPFAILGFLLGWLQIFLIAHGNIKPHMANEGFLEILRTIIKAIRM